MPDTPAMTAEPHGPRRHPRPAAPPRYPAHRLPRTECGIPGPYIHMNRADIHVTYAQVIGRAGQFPAQGVSYGLHTVPGRDVNGWLRGSLNFWLSSEGRMADDGVIRYRQTRNHSVVTLVPDKDPESSSTVRRASDRPCLPRDRPTGITQLWRGQAVRNAIGTCRRNPQSAGRKGGRTSCPIRRSRSSPGAIRGADRTSTPPFRQTSRRHAGRRVPDAVTRNPSTTPCACGGVPGRRQAVPAGPTASPRRRARGTPAAAAGPHRRRSRHPSPQGRRERPTRPDPPLAEDLPPYPAGATTTT